MRAVRLVAALALFVVVATANSGGYRYGVSDQAFYVPAVALEQHPDLFPRDRVLLEPQMHAWIGGAILGAADGWLGDDLPTLFAIVYVVTLVVYALSAVALARAFGADDWTIALVLALVALRHRIAKTGANSLEGYAHPRMLAFAIGMGAMAGFVRGRRRLAAALVVAAMIAHPTTGAWFGLALAMAAIWSHPRRTQVLAACGIAGLAAVGTLLLAAPARLAPMDAAWLAVLGEKDYLFPAEWPAYAWLLNLAYPVVLWAIHRRRRRLGLATAGETALVAGLLGLVLVFLVSVPLAELRLALVVQLQVNRVFWLLDVVVAVYVAWWIRDLFVRHGPRLPLAVAALWMLAIGRGYDVVRLEAHRPLVQIRLADDGWTDVMRWVGSQPVSWHVLADPGHAWKFGSSVRVAARRDTLLEAGKDTAMAMYDRSVALRVGDRLRALAEFDALTTADVRRLDAAYALDVFVDRADRTFDLPVLYRNAGFIAYDLR
jgi:hypothetical protein